jgi:hypothetical protein
LGVFLFKLVNASMVDVFSKLKSHLTSHDYKVLIEQPPTGLVVVGGSLWGTTPKTCQKTLTYKLTQTGQTTEITSTATLTSNYLNFTIAGCIASAVLLVLCGWIAMDLSSSAPTAWTWIASTNGQFRPAIAQLFTQVATVCTVFLGASLGLEAVILLRIRRGLNAFADAMLAEIA